MGHECMSGLVHRRDLSFLLVHQMASPFRAEEHFFDRVKQNLHGDFCEIFSRGQNRAFVHEVLEIRAGKSGCAFRQLSKRDVCAERLIRPVNLEYFFTVFHVRRVEDDASVKTARSEECRIQNVRPIRRGHHNDARVRFEPV